MRILGLTGSIGMGKSTTAGLFRNNGVAVFDADACVHRLYEGELVPALAAKFPQAIEDGKVDRAALREAVVGKPESIAALEKIVHPAVLAKRVDFLAKLRQAGAPVCVLDIPLLFETGAQKDVDAVIVVTAPPELQRARILARGTMSAAQAEQILKRQTPDAEKRARAHYIVETQHGLDFAARRVAAILRSMAV